MKRALLIAGGTVGGLGAVLAITPPQFTSSNTLNVASGGIGNPSGNGATAAAPASTPATTASQSASATPTAQQSVAATKTAKAKAVATKKAAAKSAKNNSSGSVTSAASQTPSSAPATQSATPATQSATPAPVKTTPVPAKATSSGTFVGPVVNVSYGNVQVQITVSNGKITDATALQAPSGRSDRFSSYAVPILRQQTLAAQSAQITGASGASYTSYGWYKSLQGALAKAGL